MLSAVSEAAGSETERCPGCGALVPLLEGPVHEYMLSAPGCWRTYGEVLAREYGAPAWAGRHRLAVDAYAVQHPQNADRRNRQSVAIHLMSLCLVIEQGGSDAAARRMLASAARGAREWPLLEPPAGLGEMTVTDVHGARTAERHLELVGAWARGAWEAWAPEHERVRGWLAAARG